MKISLAVLHDHITRYQGKLSLPSQNLLRDWHQVVWYDQKMNDCYETEYILLGRAKDFPDTLINRGLISIGKPSEYLLQQNDVLYFERTTPVMELYMEIQRVLLMLEHWDQKLHEAFKQDKPNVFFDESLKIFGNSIFLHDENFNLVYETPELPNQQTWQYDPLSDHYVLPLEIMNDFKINPDYLATMSTKGPTIFPEATFGYRILYQNIWQNDTYRGRICVNELERTLGQGDWYLLNYFSEMILQWIRLTDMGIRRNAGSLSKILIRLLEKETIEKRSLDEILMQHGWVSGDECFCACLLIESRDVQVNSMQYFCGRLSETFPMACIFPYENTIVIVVNSTFSDLSILEFRMKMGSILRESMLKLGISMVYDDLTNFHYMYQQAVCALETGFRKQKTFWSYSFEDYQTDYILHTALKEFPADMLCKKELHYLKEYDATHTSELSKTLRIYLEHDRNLTKTSEILEIHRSTLLYRIGKIKEVIHNDLESPKMRFQLMLSYYLLEESRGTV